jgi:hypothetical protein
VGLEIVALELTEVAAEGDLLICIEILIGEYKHEMPMPGVENLLSGEIVERLPEVDSSDLRAEREAELLHVDLAHLLPPARSGGLREGHYTGRGQGRRCVLAV